MSATADEFLHGICVALLHAAALHHLEAEGVE